MDSLNVMRSFKDGDRICYIGYENPRIDYYAAFIAAGIEKNEKCLCCLVNTSKEEFKQILSRCLKDVEKYVANGQLVFMNFIDKLSGKKIYRQKVASMWDNIVNEAKSEGYNRIRVMGETRWTSEDNLLLQVIRFKDYCFEVFQENGFTTLCHYRVDNCSDAMIEEILKHHTRALIDNGNSISNFESSELLGSNTIKFLHESVRDRAKLNQTCRHLSFINSLTAQTLYEEGPKHAAEEALDYFAQEYEAELALSIIVDKETKRIRFISCYGLDLDSVVSVVSGKLLDMLYQAANYSEPYITKDIEDSLLSELWVNKNIKYLGIIPMKNGRSIIGVTFMGWIKMQGVQSANLNLLYYFLNTVGMALDVHYVQEKTFQKKKDAEKLEALGTLTSGIAHEFNNIMAVILGNCQLLKLKTNDTGLIKYVSEVATAADDAVNVVRRIQNYSRPQITYKRINILVNEIITSALDFTRTKWINESFANGIKVDIETHLHSLKKVFVNESELREVLVNLIINAIDAMPDGGKIKIGTEDEESRVKITITDTGVGMTQDEATRAFNPFYSTKLERGTGLGLTICRNIINAHNGEIRLESKKGKGTVFTIILPEGNSFEHVREQEISQPLEPLNIFVVDDDEMVLRSVREQLATLGHTVTSYLSATELLNQASNVERVDLVITDLAMPEMSGIDLAKKLKEMNKNLSVILMTGWFDEFRNIVDRGMVEGILYKPFSLYDLQKQIEQLKSHI